MATTTNYGWTTPDDTALVKDGASAIRTLGTSVDTTTKNLNPSTTLGDIQYRSSTVNTNTRLGIGSTGQVLTVAGGVPTWAAAGASFSGCNVFNNTTQSVANATTTTAVFNDERYDTDAYHDNSTNNSRITIPAGKTGKYLVFFTIVITQSAAATNDYFETQLKKNGTTALYTVYSPQFRFNSIYFGNANIGSVVLSLTAGDYLEVLCYQNQGASVDISGNTLSQFGVTYLGA